MQRLNADTLFKSIDDSLQAVRAIAEGGPSLSPERYNRLEQELRVASLNMKAQIDLLVEAIDKANWSLDSR